jgi:hypothetical protein
MDGDHEPNVDLQYLAAMRSEVKQHVLWPVFASGMREEFRQLSQWSRPP